MHNRAGRTVKFLWKILREGMLTLLLTEQFKKTHFNFSRSQAAVFCFDFQVWMLHDLLDVKVVILKLCTSMIEMCWLIIIKYHIIIFDQVNAQAEF